MLLKPLELARAIGGGVAVAAVGTLILSMVPLLNLLGPLGYAALGFGVGEAVSVGANRKRLPMLAPIAVACLFVGFALGLIVSLVVNSRAPLSPELLRVPLLALINIQFSIGLLIGALLAWMRVR
jgi:hypothetical protein